MPTPLYALYAERMGFDVLTTTTIFAAYALGVIAALIVCGRWSDEFGRRPLLLAGIAMSILAALVFVTAGPVWQLVVARLLSGISAGIYAGAATAAVIETAPPSWHHRAAAVATAANIGGLGLGVLAGGLIAQYGPAPLRSPFLIDLLLLSVAAVGVWIIAEPVAVRDRPRPRIQKPSVPTEARPTFARAALAAGAGFAVMGSFSAVAPAFLSHVIGIDNHAVVALVIAVLFLCSASAQILGRPLSAPVAIATGCALLAVGGLVLIAALAAQQFALMIMGAVFCGIGQGLSFSKGVTALLGTVDGTRRAEVVSAYFVVAYIATSVPVIGQGVAANVWGLRAAGTALNAAIVVVAVLAAIATALAARASANGPLGQSLEAEREASA
ncbi:MFS transporter [Nocardia sp. AG03]|uniref:MFS transporter n=1 Tax=Nocardia sp. AG03 TaxID=3025312 RepID=UPI002418A8AD|nr:MFS transporter [Nocardia sp. AG03]